MQRASVFIILIAIQATLALKVGEFRTLSHAVKGVVNLINETSIRVDDFYYDGLGPDAYFYAGSKGQPGHNGYFVLMPDVRGVNGKGKLPKGSVFSGEPLTLTLPKGKNVFQIKWLSVWCERFSVNFGDMFVPRRCLGA